MTYRLIDVGRMPYEPCTRLQKSLLEEVIAGAPGALVLVEHDPVLTLGANFHAENLLHSPEEYDRLGIQVLPTERGGDVTYHGPGQLVAYPIFNVSQHGEDLHKWLRDLEETLLITISGYGITGRRYPPNTGVWVDNKKIAAIGIKVRKWVSMHGIALNCDNDLAPFETIIPCGIVDHGVTSISQETGRKIGIDEVKPRLVEAFGQVFGVQFEPESANAELQS